MNHVNYQKQSGAVLFVSLIILLLMTIIGLASMKTTVMEEKMAGNTINRGIAFQAAESALRSAEAYLSTTALLPVFEEPTASGSGLYQPAIAPDQRWKLVDWSDASKYVEYASTLSVVAFAPQYIIEELPITKEGGFSLEAGVAGVVRHYRITSRGVGGTDKAVVMLQTTYK